MAVLAAAWGAPTGAQAQDAGPLLIPYLASATHPEALDFAAARCDVSREGSQMLCRFRQVFLTPASVDPQVCAITTNGYELPFARVDAAHWRHETEPEGDCGIVETTLLTADGGPRWTMTVTQRATKNAGTERCIAAPEPAEIYDWRSVTRKLPCTSVIPAAIER